MIAEGTPEQIIEQTPTDATGASTGRIDPLGRRTTLRRDARGNLVQIIDAMGHATTLEYNPLDLVTTLRDALGHEWQQEYDGRGHLVQATDPLGRTTRYRHDARGRTVEVIDAKGGSKRLAWDEADRLVAYTDCSGQTTRFAYDALGQPVLRTDALGQQARYEYNDAGQLIRVIEPSSPAAPGSQPTTPIHLYAWNGEGHLLAYTDPMGQSTRYTYDGMGRPLTRIDAAGRSLAYHYDRAGRLIASLPAQGSPLARELFAFDPAGNLLDSLPGKDGQPVDTTLGVVGDNRLRFYQDLHFEYDVHGNVTKRTRGNQKAGTQEVLDLTWNADHQLIETNTTRHGVTQATRYAYDPLGRRVAKSDAFGSTHYLWDGDLMVHSQRGGRQALYIYEPGSFVPLATIQGAVEEHSTYWYQCDQIGAPLELTDEQGQVAWAADYKVWGEAVMRSVLRTGTDDRPVSVRARGSKPVAPPPPPPVEQPFRFQGQQFDEETGLHYNRFRYYDPVVGRFVSQDPIGLFGGFNLFLFGNNTFTWFDQLGLAGTTTHSKGNTIITSDYGVPDKSTFEPKQGIGKYKRLGPCGPTAQQTAAVQGQPCVVCGGIEAKMVADHIDPLVVEHYRTGTNDVVIQTQVSSVQSHCPTCSRIQGWQASAFSKCMAGKI